MQGVWQDLSGTHRKIVDDQTVHFMLQVLPNASNTKADNRDSKGHGLDVGDAEGFALKTQACSDENIQAAHYLHGGVGAGC